MGMTRKSISTKATRRLRRPSKHVGSYVNADGEDKPTRDTLAFEACADGTLIIYATLPDGDGEPIHIEPERVGSLLASCGDALARKPSRR
jgi:hypothetical protein